MTWILDDDKLVNEILGRAPDEDDDNNCDDTLSSDHDENTHQSGVCHGNTFQTFSDCLNWLHQQDESTEYSRCSLKPTCLGSEKSTK